MNEKGCSTLKICEKKFNYLNYSEKTKITFDIQKKFCIFAQ